MLPTNMIVILDCVLSYFLLFIPVRMRLKRLKIKEKYSNVIIIIAIIGDIIT